MPCPFLTRLRQNSNNYNPQLLKTFTEQITTQSRTKTTDRKHVCPFLNEVNNLIKEVKNDDTIICVDKAKDKTVGMYDYDKFFNEQIMKKKQEHSYRIFKKVDRLAVPGKFPRAIEHTYGPNMITVWCSNDYLGMSCHPSVIESAKNALETYGSGAGGTRNISGNSTLHERLERSIAKLHNKEKALIFSSCFVANDATLFTLLRALPGCHVFSDQNNHASMIQGVRNSRVPKHIFRHNDCEHLEELLQTVDKDVPKIVAFETVHSMSGTICPLERLCDLSHKYGALTFVDEVHAVGLYGFHGAGVGERDNVLHKIDIISGTLGKAFGNVGGYIAGDSNLIDTVRSYAPGFIFTTSLPPSVLAGAIESIKILSSDEGRALRTKHQNNVGYLKKCLLKNKLPIEQTPSHIIPIRVGDPKKCTLISDTLLRDYKQYIQAINYPTVVKGEEKLRLAPTPFHTRSMIDELVRDLKEVWDQLRMPFNYPNSGTSQKNNVFNI
ncbi:5-aminolevulinate synthase, erythroid-specific, mitochondrial [Aethina tumida]|uniref:5-aminolevulinate synthase, erythroid-specific, mitochondrial n=1 Tax=Aethina tumida TaxID=116153 RepID=UPI00096AF483|nr:5-aminolevulinate synthase, erythroid-specific, mitochondrial [Aethina tumida]